MEREGRQTVVLLGPVDRAADICPPPAPGQHNLAAGLENCGGASRNKANDLMTAEEARASSQQPGGMEGGRLLACVSTGLKPPFIKLKQRCQMLDDAEHYFKTLLLYIPNHPHPHTVGAWLFYEYPGY